MSTWSPLLLGCTAAPEGDGWVAWVLSSEHAALQRLRDLHPATESALALGIVLLCVVAAVLLRFGADAAATARELELDTAAVVQRREASAEAYADTMARLRAQRTEQRAARQATDAEGLATVTASATAAATVKAGQESAETIHAALRELRRETSCPPSAPPPVLGEAVATAVAALDGGDGAPEERCAEWAAMARRCDRARRDVTAARERCVAAVDKADELSAAVAARREVVRRQRQRAAAGRTETAEDEAMARALQAGCDTMAANIARLSERISAAQRHRAQ